MSSSEGDAKAPVGDAKVPPTDLRSELVRTAVRRQVDPPTKEEKAEWEALIAEAKKAVAKRPPPPSGKAIKITSWMPINSPPAFSQRITHDGYHYPSLKIRATWCPDPKSNAVGYITIDPDSIDTKALEPGLQIGKRNYLGKIFPKMPLGVLDQIAQQAVDPTDRFIYLFSQGGWIHINDLNKILREKNLFFRDEDLMKTHYVELDRSKFMEVPLRLIPGREIKNAIVVQSHFVISTETHYLLVFPAWTQDTCLNASVSNTSFYVRQEFKDEPYLLAEVRDLDHVESYRYNRRGKLCGGTFRVFVKIDTWDPKHCWLQFRKPEIHCFYDTKTDTYTPHVLKAEISSKQLVRDEQGIIKLNDREHVDVKFNVKDHKDVLFEVELNRFWSKFWSGIPKSFLVALVMEDPRRYLTLERAMKYFSCRAWEKRAYLDTLGEEKKSER